jgi:hypothetical protein
MAGGFSRSVRLRASDPDPHSTSLRTSTPWAPIGIGVREGATLRQLIWFAQTRRSLNLRAARTPTSPSPAPAAESALPSSHGSASRTTLVAARSLPVPQHFDTELRWRMTIMVRYGAKASSKIEASMRPLRSSSGAYDAGTGIANTQGVSWSSGDFEAGCEVNRVATLRARAVVPVPPAISVMRAACC